MSRQNFCNRQGGHGYNEGLHVPCGGLQRRVRSPYFVQPPESILNKQKVIEVGNREGGNLHIIPLRNVI